MLAGIALLLGTTLLFKMGKKAYVWITLLPTTWLLIVTLAAGWQQLFDSNPKVGFLAHANIFKTASDSEKILAPAKTAAQMKQILINDYVDATLTAIFMVVVVIVLISALRIWFKVISNHKLTLHEEPYVPRDNNGDVKTYA
jgi:carbon starvation protein